MEDLVLTCDRIFLDKKFTISRLMVDGKYLCDVLEDRVRNLPKECPYTSKGVACKCEEKVYGETAIPHGSYEIKLTYSNRFKKILPELLNVPHFQGIRIHTGNKAEDTEGCLIVGTWDGLTINWVSSSKVAFDKLMEVLEKATEENRRIVINIEMLV